MGWRVAGLVVAIVGSTAAIVVAPAPAGALTEPTIVEPAPGAVVPSGRVRIAGTLSGTALADVVYAVDVSGSTSSPSSLDCSGDGTTAADDFNGDGAVGDVLDCEIAGVIALNTSIQSRSVEVALVGFGSSAAVADVSSEAGTQTFIAPEADGPDSDGQNGLPDIVNVATSLRRGSIGLFQARSVGTGTSFDAALGAVETAYSGRPATARRVVFLLSDGQSSVSTATTAPLARLAAAGVRVNTFAIGTAATCAGPLTTIATTTGGFCVPVANPSTLSAVLGTLIPEDVTVEISLTGPDGQTLGPQNGVISPIGDWSTTFQVSTPGTWTSTVTVSGDAGTATRSRTFTVARDGLAYVALGDSYSAGEGIFPRLTGPLDEACHRAEEAWPRLVEAPGSDTPIATDPDTEELFQFAACSSAVIANALSIPQRRDGQTVPLQIGFVSPETDLVTLTMGGNDVNFGDVLKHCATQFDCFNDGFRTLNTGTGIRLVDWINLRMAVVSAQLPSLYRQVRAASAFNATVAVATYPELFNGSNQRIGRFLPFVGSFTGCPEFEVFDSAERGDLNEAARALEAVIVAAALDAGVISVATVEAFRGKGVCGEGVAGDEWITGVDFSWSVVSPNDASFHPTEKGARTYARLVSEAIEAGAPDLGQSAQAETLSSGPVALAAASSIDPATAPDGIVTVDEIRQRAAALEPFFGPLPTLTDDEILEALDLELDELGVQSLAAVAGTETDECDGWAAFNQHLVVTGEGFAPGSTVQLGYDSDSGPEVALGSVVADAGGTIRASVTVPHVAHDPWVAFRATGQTAGGTDRVLTALVAVPEPGTTCALRAAETGQLALGGLPAPAAAGLDVPAPLLRPSGRALLLALIDELGAQASTDNRISKAVVDLVRAAGDERSWSGDAIVDPPASQVFERLRTAVAELQKMAEIPPGIAAVVTGIVDVAESLAAEAVGRAPWSAEAAAHLAAGQAARTAGDLAGAIKRFHDAVIAADRA